ncbi:sterol desaturase family protein [Ferruginivarius sediminum]|uniref:Fatty acid hydroxylase family protein n=1 Tax=Ferruginivarius sediminum TaxID=2661937 RepID=A0A369T8Y1_9PROT|nr:sterol desaturase family protein [Ferruginivarius sediminum]RDD60825.1 fatty acid hydroxylase family protein [Ferruginivarius sediminum]
MADLGIWKREYRLDKMSLGELWVAFFLYPAIQVYLLLAAGSAYVSWRVAESVAPIAVSVLLVLLIYPLVWYLLHRYVLHGRFLYRSPLTAKVWKRIHFDHHRDPHDLKVLFGALYTTLPTIFLVVTPIGWLIGGLAGASSALCAGLLVTCFYEFCHCVQHLRYTPKWPFLQRIKKLHLQHHFHDENRNYGITSFLPDKAFGTFDEEVKGRARSETVFNLGYTRQEVRRYPWVARLTPDLDEEKAAREGVDRRHPRAT